MAHRRWGLKEREPPSPQRSADTYRPAFALQLRRTEREYGVSLLANFEALRFRWVIHQASGLRTHTRSTKRQRLARRER